MRLSYNEKTNILKCFPHLELSYEKKLHKKVQTDIYLTIPKGKKFFAWFKNYNNKNLCFLLEIDRRYNSIENININICSFDKILCSGKGTILYGTIFYINKKKLFNIENIYYSRGYSLIYNNQSQKLKEINNIMQNHIKQVFCTKNTVVFGTPIIDTNYYNLKAKIKKLPYSIYCIQYRLLYKNKPFMNEFIKIKKDIQKIFLVKPTIIDDIYDLYFKNDDKIEKYDIACIPDYKTSVMMNSLFRNIKENRNLDLLEESDDEEEFENINIDKFVYLDKTFKMKCVYIENHNSWKPIEISNDEISPKREIIYYKKNNR
tara:strand:- start:360 stop:1310 length:951 start_codon:yes stop_codon:yes gene_type:complete